MKIAVQAADLDRERVDGTRVYLKELLNRFGALAPSDSFVLYHERDFYTLLQPIHYPHYEEKKIPFPWAWMQTRFAWSIFCARPDVLFLPIQAAPLFLPRDVKVVATIHDVAWKRYPETFSWKDRCKLNLLLGRVIKRADKLIAVSEATKRDVLRYFPQLDPVKVQVIHHGFDREFFKQRISQEVLVAQLEKYQLVKHNYILYVGALQPRKNLVRLILAFESLKERNPEAKLVLAGEVAWLAQEILSMREKSRYRDDILLLGKVNFETLRILYQGAKIFAFPSLYEGFGLPLLEAFASGTPVLTADNSSLREIASDAALYCDAQDRVDIAKKLEQLWSDDLLGTQLEERGYKRLESFSWETCAKETLHYLKTP